MGILKQITYPALRAFICVTILFMCPVAYGQDEETSALAEQKIKAALVYNFIKYTIWPDTDALSKNNRFNVCMFGGDPFESYLSSLEGRTAQKFVIFLSRINTVDEAKNCNLVFVHPRLQSSLPALFNFLKDKPILTVSDIAEFAHKGGMVGLTTENGYINMYVNKKVVSNAGLNIQDRLLKLAKSVSG